MTGKRSILACASIVAAVGVALLAAAPAGADVQDGCHATLNGVNLDNIPVDPDHAIRVGQNDVIPMTMTSVNGKTFDELRISLEFFGADWDIYDAPAGGGTWSQNVDVHSFAKFGVGLYELKGIGNFAPGQAGGCDGAVFIRVSGDPFSTVAGIGAAASAGVGVLSVLGAGLGAGGGGGSGPGGSLTEDDLKKEEEHQRTDAEIPADYSPADAVEDAVKGGRCFLFALAALVLLPLLLLFGSGAALMAVAAPVAVKVRRRTWPFALGAFGGLLTGVGAGVLLQEYAVAYPTRTYGIIYIVGGILFGLAVPLLRRALSR
ncbi:MAG TPA: hypothetical protein VKR79_01470 [Gaiellaceae bacterium]|nr:hypothetical protein [Gaiellaceae bacterium]